MQHLNIIFETTPQQIIDGIVSVIPICFGERILSIYITGSLNRQQLTVTSDLDITVVFRGDMSQAEYEQFMQLRAGLQLLSPLRLDLWADAEHKIRDRPANQATRSATCLYGEDFFHTLTPQPIEHFAMRYVHKAIHYMSVLRGRPKPNPTPLNYPQADVTYFGYTQFADFDGAQQFTQGVRIIVNMLTACLSARLATEHQIEATTKEDSIRYYADHIADQWADYSRTLVHLIKTDLHYHLPSTPDQQTQLHHLLEQLLSFENDMLTHFELIILENLKSDNRRQRKLALVALMNVQFNNEQIKSVLQEITEIDDMDLLNTVKAHNL